MAEQTSLKACRLLDLAISLKKCASRERVQSCELGLQEPFRCGNEISLTPGAQGACPASIGQCGLVAFKDTY